jgi:hypothetical protein
MLSQSRKTSQGQTLLLISDQVAKKKSVIITLTPELKDLMTLMLIKDPSKRITLPEIKVMFLSKFGSVTKPQLAEISVTDSLL